MTGTHRRAISSSLLVAVALFVVSEVYPEQKLSPAKPERKPECVGLGCGETEQKCIGLGCKGPQQQTPIDVRLTVAGKAPLSATKGRIHFGEIKLTAAVTGLTSQHQPLYQFAAWSENVVVEYGTPIETSGEFNSNSSWTWTPPFAGLGVKFTVTMKVATVEGEIVRTVETGSYHIVDDAAARELFSTRIAAVMTYPRCLNCHNGGDSPTQGDDRHLHVPSVNRQTDCTQCHGLTNGTTPGSPPGAFGWRLPPAQFAFVNKSAEQLCRQIKDPGQNGGRSLEELRDHVRNDTIIRWAWNPGPGRTKPPYSWESFAYNNDGIFVTWVRIGAACPEPTNLLGPK